MKFNPIMWDIQTKVTTTSRFTISAQNGRFGATTNVAQGWLRSVVGADNRVYCVPRSATGVLIFDPVSGTASVNDYGLNLTGVDKWNRGFLAPNGKIYFSPRNSVNFLVVNTLTQSAYLSNLGLSLPATNNRYQSFVNIGNGRLLLTPATAGNVIIIDTNNDTAITSTLGLGTVPACNYAIMTPNGDVIALLDDGSGFLIIDTKAMTARVDALGMPLQPALGAYSGLILGMDGRYYGVPQNATNILVLDTELMLATTETFGVDLSQSNKWVTGALSPDGKIYCAPGSATDVLIIDTINQTAVRDTLGLNWTGTFKRYSSATVGNQIWFGPGASADTVSATGNDITRITFTYTGSDINPQWWHTGLINR